MSTVDTEAQTVGRWRRVATGAAALASRVHRAAPKPIRWFLDKPNRIVALAWLLGLLVVGSARMALADDIIVGPDLAHGGPRTLYETYDLWSYQLTVKPDEEASGWLDLGKGVLEIIGFVNYLLLWICLGLLYGGLTLLEWLLNLNLYSESSGQIDQAVRMMADHVFWPLIVATTAVGAFMAYARWRGDGRGVITDLLWVVVAAVMGIGFAAGPSVFAGPIDEARQELSSGVIAGSTQFVATTGNPVGFPQPQIGGDPQTAGTRKLVDGLWSTFGATPWCYAQFRDLDICREAGNHALANDDVWQGWMAELDSGGSPAVFQDRTGYVRGQEMTRTGVLLLMVVVTVPLSWMLVRLVIAGLTAVVGFLLMLLLGAVFVALLPMEGMARKIGIQYAVSTAGMALMSTLITLVISGLMVLTMIFASFAQQYGFFLIAVLNIAALMAAMKAKHWLEAMTTFGGGTSSGFATALIARSVMRTVMRGVGGGAGLALGAGRNLAKNVARDARGPLGRLAADRLAAKMRPSGGVGLDDGPLRGFATRMRPPGGDGGQPRVGGGGVAALPGAPAPARRTTAHSGAGAHSSNGAATGSSAGAGAGGRVPPMAAQSGGGGHAASSRTVSPTDISDGHLQRNASEAQRRTGHRGRVWVSHPGGRGVAPLEDSPREAKPNRSGVYRVSDAKRSSATRLRRGFFGGDE